MSAMNIRRGLRRLEFTPQEGAPRDATTHVLVEFVVDGKLPNNQVVSINLGIRAGIETSLAGVPTLLDREREREGRKEAKEFVYRLEGNVR